MYANEGAEINRLKKRLCGLLPTLHPFDGKKPISLLTFLSQLREGLNALGVAEAAAVRVLAFLLDGDAKSFYDSVTMTATRSRNTNRTYTWPYVVHSLIDRYLTDTELQDAYALFRPVSDACLWYYYQMDPRGPLPEDIPGNFGLTPCALP